MYFVLRPKKNKMLRLAKKNWWNALLDKIDAHQNKITIENWSLGDYTNESKWLKFKNQAELGIEFE